MVSLILIIIASICNALMDTVADEKHFRDSIFKNCDEYWWLKTKSWTRKHMNKAQGKMIPQQFSDAWHTFKTIMIFALVGAIVSFEGNPLIWFAILGIAWNITFSLFYEKLLKTK